MNTLSELRSGALKGAKRIKLSCGLEEVPSEILEMAESLEILDLSGNKISDLPENFNRLHNLKIAFFSDNNFTEFPSILSSCDKLEMIGFKANKIKHIPENSISKNIRWLILTNNQISNVPLSIGHCHRLQKCMLAGNKISELPKEMASCRNIELLRISANNFSELPDWLLSLPRLSWLAYAGNPLTAKSPVCDELNEVSWHSLKIKEQLGEGASGIISRAEWAKSTKDIQEVAVKIFKGEITSDGLPADEMNACIGAASHPNLVNVLGKLSGHPEGKQGLIFELIPSSYKNLGGPPSFETCTRDTFQKDRDFLMDEIIKIGLGISSAAAHLHVKGIMHGDLYAHNILVDRDANPLFGDFGAATVYDKNFGGVGAIEKIEVRAFGYLLDDLLQNMDPAEKKSKSLKKMMDLRDKCLNETIFNRPDFKNIYAQLASL